MAWYDYIYDLEELQQAQSFKSDQNLLKNKKRQKNHWLKSAALWAIWCTFMNSFRAQPIASHFTMFTNWMSNATLIAWFLEHIIIYSPHLNIKNAPNMHCLHHLFYTLSLFTSVIVTLVYWGLTHKKHLKDIEKKYEGNQLQIEISITHAYIIHIVPQFCAFILFLTSNTILISKHMKGMVGFGITYSIVNFIQTKRRGKPLYWWLDWKDYNSILVLLALHAVFLVVFYGMAKLDEWYTGRRIETKSTKKGEIEKMN